MEKIPMTAEGFAAIDAELKKLKTVERPNIIAAIAEARSHGDLSENAEYHSAKERQSFIEGRILELEDKIARGQIIDIKALSGSTIKFGATVKVLDEDTEEAVSYTHLWRWCAIKTTIASSSVQLKTLTQWACTLAIQ